MLERARLLNAARNSGDSGWWNAFLKGIDTGPGGSNNVPGIVAPDAFDDPVMALARTALEATPDPVGRAELLLALGEKVDCKDTAELERIVASDETNRQRASRTLFRVHALRGSLREELIPTPPRHVSNESERNAIAIAAARLSVGFSLVSIAGLRSAVESVTAAGEFSDAIDGRLVILAALHAQGLDVAILQELQAIRESKALAPLLRAIDRGRLSYWEAAAHLLTNDSASASRPIAEAMKFFRLEKAETRVRELSLLEGLVLEICDEDERAEKLYVELQREWTDEEHVQASGCYAARAAIAYRASRIEDSIRFATDAVSLATYHTAARITAMLALATYDSKRSDVILRDALRTASECGDPVVELMVHAYEGERNEVEHPDEALSAYWRVVAILERLSNPLRLAYTLYRIGVIEIERERYDRAKPPVLRALAIYDSESSRRFSGWTRLRLATIVEKDLEVLGSNKEVALESLYSRALADFVEGADIHGQAWAFVGLARDAFREKRVEESLTYLQQAGRLRVDAGRRTQLFEEIRMCLSGIDVRQAVSLLSSESASLEATGDQGGAGEAAFQVGSLLCATDASRAGEAFKRAEELFAAAGLVERASAARSQTSS